jgi:alpha-L-fucosidase
MKLSRTTLIFLLVLFIPAFLAARQDPEKKNDDRLKWWTDARFGMFIHWGIYAVPAGEWSGKTNYGEWIRTSAKIPLEEYDQFRVQFNPVQFDADSWVRMARDAGMKYIVITSKHHDGFCMFDTKQTDFNILNSPFQRDPMKDLAAACRKYGVKLCFYYSIMDWHHPDYLPRRNWESDRPVGGADFDRYVEYMKAQLKELLANYGDIGVLWFDGEWESTWNEKCGKEIYDYVRSLQPEIIVNNRVGAGRHDMEGLTKEGSFGGDFGTPEQQIPATGLPGVDWETCMTMNDHWGYNKADQAWKSTGEMIRMLADIASKGGNYLLNVGPTAEGTFPVESMERLKQIGRWMEVNSASIYGTGASPFDQPDWGRCTRKDTRNGVVLYLHVFDWPADGKLKISGLLNEPAVAWLLADPKKKKLGVSRLEDALIIQLPEKAPDSINSLVVLEVKGKLDLTSPPGITAEFSTFVDSLKVDILSDRENIEIRFTIDDSEPTTNSLRYLGALKLKGSTTIKARCFRDGKPVSATASKTFRRVFPYAPKAVAQPMAGLSYQYFEGEWDSLPVFKSLKPVSTGIIEEINFNPRKRDERFAFVYSGYIQVPATAVYGFFLESDDGSKLFINDRVVVSNDGLHGSRVMDGSVALKKGFHKIRIEYFDRTGNDLLKLYYKTQGMKEQEVPSTWFFYNQK